MSYADVVTSYITCWSRCWTSSTPHIKTTEGIWVNLLSYLFYKWSQLSSQGTYNLPLWQILAKTNKCKLYFGTRPQHSWDVTTSCPTSSFVEADVLWANNKPLSFNCEQLQTIDAPRGFLFSRLLLIILILITCDHVTQITSHNYPLNSEHKTQTKSLT